MHLTRGNIYSIRSPMKRSVNVFVATRLHCKLPEMRGRNYFCKYYKLMESRQHYENLLHENNDKKRLDCSPFLVNLCLPSFRAPWTTPCHQSSLPSEACHLSGSTSFQMFTKFIRKIVGPVSALMASLAHDSNRA